jgi:ketosteroid isomerase-like protein
MSNGQSIEDRNTQTAIQYLQHIVDGSGNIGKPAFDKAFALVSDDFEIEVLPSTMKMPKMKLERYRKWVEPMVADMFSDFSMEIVETTAQDDRVVVEAKSSATPKDGRFYGQEYRISFKFNKDGKITLVKEFVDSLFSARFYGLIEDEQS